MDNNPSGALSLFKGPHFDSAIVMLCVLWYITYKLSYHDLKQVMAERGIDLAHTTILRWVQCYVPKSEERWSRFARPVGKSCRVDQAYIRIRGVWKYLHRAVDKEGNTVDFLLSQHSGITSAEQFFTQGVDRQGAPEKITVDGYAATHTAIGELKESAILPVNVLARTSKYLKNLIEQGHRRVKKRVYPMQGFRRFGNAAIALSEVEIGHKIKKGEFDTPEVRQEDCREQEHWQAVLAA